MQDGDALFGPSRRAVGEPVREGERLTNDRGVVGICESLDSPLGRASGVTLLGRSMLRFEVMPTC